MATQKPKPIELDQLYEGYRSNVNEAMLSVLAEQLGVSVLAVDGMGVGYDFLYQAWIFPERDETGKITGMTRRGHDGKKFMVPGSKRGLSYMYNMRAVQGKAAYSPGKHNWVRASVTNPCPLCLHTDWCLLSANNPANPAAVICGRTVSKDQRECGYLHILSPDGDMRQAGTSVLLDTEEPILIVEGGSDVCAAFDIGFVAIGRPNDQGGLGLLKKMPIANRRVIVVGENDAGAGVRGMEATYSSLQKITGQLTKLLPPQGVKDLRAWVSGGLTHDGLLEAAESSTANAESPGIFPDDIAATIAERWLRDELTRGGEVCIRQYHGQWMEYKDGVYQELEEAVLRGRLYSYLKGKFCSKENLKGEITVVPFKPSRAKVNDIFDALNQWCPIMHDPPSWLDERAEPCPSDLVVFKNGMLDVRAYCRGEVVMYPTTPTYFNMCRLAHDLNLDQSCDVWLTFLHDITNGDQQIVDLLGEWFGYNLTPDMSQERLLMIIGRPRSGKGTILSALQAMLGAQYCATATFASMSSSFGLQPLVGKLSAVIGDARIPERREAEIGLEKLLQITGGDPVTVNRKHLPELPIVHLSARFTIAGNEIPQLIDHSRALEARTSLICLPNSYVGKEDRDLKPRIVSEARSGALVPWALEGLRRLRANGTFTVPASSEMLAARFRASVSPLTEFIADYCHVFSATDLAARKHASKSVVYCESKDLVYEAYCRWNENRGANHPMLKTSFTSAMQRELPTVDTVQIMHDHKRFRAFVGLRLNRFAYSELLNLPNGATNLPQEALDEEERNSTS